MEEELKHQCLNLIHWLKLRSSSDPVNHDDLDEKIDNLLKQDINCFTLKIARIEAAELEEPVASLATMLLGLIDEGNYSTEKLIKLIKKYHLEPLLGTPCSIVNSTLLEDSVYYGNKEFFHFLLNNHFDLFDINHQSDVKETIFHDCAERNEETSLYFINIILSIPNIKIDFNLKDDEQRTAIDLFKEYEYDHVVQLLNAKKERDELNEKLVSEVKTLKAKVKI
jgi:hypothetical protein